MVGFRGLGVQKSRRLGFRGFIVMLTKNNHIDSNSYNDSGVGAQGFRALADEAQGCVEGVAGGNPAHQFCERKGSILRDDNETNQCDPNRTLHSRASVC